MQILRNRSVNSSRLERWLGAPRMEQLANHVRNGGGEGKQWYGPAINLRDVPGSVWLTGDGDFIGDFDRGFFHSAADSFADHAKQLWKRAGKPIYIPDEQFAVGFTSISDALARASGGNSQRLNGMISKSGPTGVLAVASTQIGRAHV